MSSKLGHIHFTDPYWMLWGNKNSSVETVRSVCLGRELPFVKLRQTHSDIIHVHSRFDSAHDKEGDAIVTCEKKVVLGISTADCLPVHVIQRESGWIGSIHAGWKGVARKIVPQTIQKIVTLSNHSSPFSVWIGPHIQMASFEVELDVCQQILASLGQATEDPFSPYHHSHVHSSRGPDGQMEFRLSLAKIVCQQLKQLKVPVSHLWISSVDTKTNSSFHSYRRDREKAGRQLSLLASR